MQTRRLSFWLYWSSVSALVALIGSGVSADANISPQAERVAIGAAPSAAGAPTADAVVSAMPVSDSVTLPLAEAVPAPAAEKKPPVQVGIASWYGGRHQGRLTASGERFDEHKLTAAHRSLPLDTKVKVTNLENGRSVEVMVNDRGPYVKGRVLDLSTRAAKVLGMEKEGLARVRIEPVPQRPVPQQTASADID